MKLSASNLLLISRYRSALMGIAILWVMVYHTYVNIPFPLLEDWVRMGYGGVDIFLFLSGIGIYFSLERVSSYRSFYKHRLRRILPIYVLVVGIWSLCMGTYPWVEFLWSVSLLGFWTGHAYFEWYIPSLMMLYLCAPFCKKCVTYSPCLLILLSFVAMVLGVLAEQWQGDAKGMQLLFFARIPIFCIGMCFGRWIKEGIILRNSVRWFLYILSFCGFITLVVFFHVFQPEKLWEWGLCWLPFICIVPGLCIGLSGGFERMGKESLPVRVFSFLGSISLELYLIHLKLFEYSHVFSQELHLSRVTYLSCVFVLSIPVSWGLSRLLRPKSCFRQEKSALKSK